MVVDYAHTPDGLEVALDAPAALAGGGRVLCVFGCGGDRDRGKRPADGRGGHGRGPTSWCVTSDNPRSEDPPAIIEEIRAGSRPAART